MGWFIQQLQSEKETLAKPCRVPRQAPGAAPSIACGNEMSCAPCSIWGTRTRNRHIPLQLRNKQIRPGVAAVPAAALQLRFARIWRAAGAGGALSGGAGRWAGAWLYRRIRPAASQERARIPPQTPPVFCCATLCRGIWRPVLAGRQGRTRMRNEPCLDSMLRQVGPQYCRARADSVAVRTKPPPRCRSSSQRVTDEDCRSRRLPGRGAQAAVLRPAGRPRRQGVQQHRQGCGPAGRAPLRCGSRGPDPRAHPCDASVT
ncbi:hypothetical protein D3C86_1531180 [compost metagenome]